MLQKNDLLRQFCICGGEILLKAERKIQDLGELTSSLTRLKKTTKTVDI